MQSRPAEYYNWKYLGLIFRINKHTCKFQYFERKIQIWANILTKWNTIALSTVEE